ncbi:phospholipase A-2-activating protein-like [Anneissia japonica]|uniref:phospholipase A-2-activating protein-like n=1 Tax=Anneissia japonica TaxID=1529436 RepID=UPI001425B047|nr:phospholipase A-2-activating protein-like [Anneissia japonica]
MESLFTLSCTLVGHEGDVRAISAGNHPTEASILTSSRDRTSRLWVHSSEGVSYFEGLCMKGHENFVSCLCVMPPSDKYPTGLIVTGSNDFKINAYTLDSVLPVYTLTGHANTVCCLAAGKFGTLLSGSWDRTAKVWLNEKNVMTLKGHEATVWAVAIIPANGLMITGSADKTIKTWKAGKCEQTIIGHTDCVRALAVISETQFLSSSNDTTIRRWTINGECMFEYKGHTGFVYSIALLPNGEDFVTSGEDRTVRVWVGGQCHQTITLPAQSVWCVTSLSNGDIAAGSSDNMARVFTRDPSRKASQDEVDLFNQQVASSAIPVQSSDLGGIKPEDLPGKEDLLNPGKKDGQTKLVKVGNTVEAYSWSQAEGKWSKIGDVVGSSDGKQTAGQKVMYEGKEYDYVFSVDMEEGRPALKLPYNVSDDPWHVAQQFIHKHELSQAYLEQIANFIISNTAGVTLGTAAPAYTDPYTGGGRYVPQGSSSGAQPPTVHSDPFTGGARHVPTSSMPSSSASSQKMKYFPKKGFITFDTANLQQIIGKITELNGNVGDDYKLESSEIEQLRVIAEAASQTNSSESLKELHILHKALKWPSDQVFPILDILRLSIRNQFVNQYFCNEQDGATFLSYLQHVSSPNSKLANKMLVFRTLCNAFQCNPGALLLRSNREDIISLLVDSKNISNKNLQIALSTVLLNYAVQQHDMQNGEAKLQLLSAVAAVLEVEQDEEATFRLLVTLGTLLHNDKDSIFLAKSLDIIPTISQLQNKTLLPKLAECAEDVVHLLQ